jgi:uncharacterized membrane protein YhaH (DUF805 family)
MEKEQKKNSYPEFLVKNWIDSMKRSFDFSGRTTRKEYWSLVLANFILLFFILILEKLHIIPVISIVKIFTFITLLQRLSALVRRFRDADITPWSILLSVSVFDWIFIPWGIPLFLFDTNNLSLLDTILLILIVIVTLLNSKNQEQKAE